VKELEERYARVKELSDQIAQVRRRIRQMQTQPVKGINIYVDMGDYGFMFNRDLGISETKQTELYHKLILFGLKQYKEELNRECRALLMGGEEVDHEFKREGTDPD